MEKEEILKRLDSMMLILLNNAINAETKCLAQFNVHNAMGVLHAAAALDVIETNDFITINRTLCRTNIGFDL